MRNGFMMVRLKTLEMLYATTKSLSIFALIVVKNLIVHWKFGKQILINKVLQNPNTRNFLLRISSNVQKLKPII